MSTNFVIADEILEARDDARRAAVLLRISDAVLMEKAGPIVDACAQSGFTDGGNYVAVRLALQSAVRSRRGELPPILVNQVEHFRRGLVAIAGNPK